MLLKAVFFFSRNIKFNYCILDEGHVIKNGKTKLSKAVKQLTANYRIILSGTPIQVTDFLFWMNSRKQTRQTLHSVLLNLLTIILFKVYVVKQLFTSKFSKSHLFPFVVYLCIGE